MPTTPPIPPTNRSMPQCTIIPVLGYEDVGKAIVWLCETFGFAERWRIENHRAQLTFGECAIALTKHNPSGSKLPAGHSLLVRVHNVNSHYEHAKQCGVKILHPLADYPYGERQYTAEDIGGHVWTFSQSIADVAPEEWGGISAKPKFD